MERKNLWCMQPLDTFSLENRVKKWFINNFRDKELIENDLMFLLIENPTNYHNITLSQCLDWLKGTYGETYDKTTVEHLLIDLTVTYTDILSMLKRGKINLNKYILKYYFNEKI